MFQGVSGEFKRVSWELNGNLWNPGCVSEVLKGFLEHDRGFTRLRSGPEVFHWDSVSVSWVLHGVSGGLRGIP